MNVCMYAYTQEYHNNFGMNGLFNIRRKTNLIWVTSESFNVHIHMTLKRYVAEFL